MFGSYGLALFAGVPQVPVGFSVGPGRRFRGPWAQGGLQPALPGGIIQLGVTKDWWKRRSEHGRSLLKRFFQKAALGGLLLFWGASLFS